MSKEEESKAMKIAEEIGLDDVVTALMRLGLIRAAGQLGIRTAAE